MASGDSVAKLNAARFLRDTAENTIMYFRDAPKSGVGQLSSNRMKELMADLQSTCKAAQASVVTLSGGRKRKFDRHAFEVLPRKAKYDRSYHDQHRSRRDDHSPPIRPRAERDRGSKRWQDSERAVRPRVKEWQTQQSDFGEQNPAGFDYNQGYGHDYGREHAHDYGREHGHDYDYDYDEGQFRERGYGATHDLAHDQSQRSIGYNRPVDSYQPGTEAAASTHAHPFHSEPYPESRSWTYEGQQEFASAAEQYGQGYGHGHGQEEEYGHWRGHGHGRGGGGRRGGRGRGWARGERGSGNRGG